MFILNIFGETLASRKLISIEEAWAILYNAGVLILES